MRLDHCTACDEYRPIQARNRCEKCYTRYLRRRPDPCGSVEGWRNHRRTHTTVCEPCAAARAQDIAARAVAAATQAEEKATNGPLPQVMPAIDVLRLRRLVAADAAHHRQRSAAA